MSTPAEDMITSHAAPAFTQGIKHFGANPEGFDNLGQTPAIADGQTAISAITSHARPAPMASAVAQMEKAPVVVSHPRAALRPRRAAASVVAMPRVAECCRNRSHFHRLVVPLRWSSMEEWNAIVSLPPAQQPDGLDQERTKSAHQQQVTQAVGCTKDNNQFKVVMKFYEYQ